MNRLHWENLLLVPFLWLSLVIAKHENVTTGRMPVKVTIKEYITAFQRTLHHELRVVVDWVEFWRWADPLSIEVVAHERTSVVTDNNAVRIQHWHNLEDKSAAQELSMVVIANEKVYDTIHEPGCIGLTRMHSGGQDDWFAHGYVHRVG